MRSDRTDTRQSLWLHPQSVERRVRKGHANWHGDASALAESDSAWAKNVHVSLGFMNLLHKRRDERKRGRDWREITKKVLEFPVKPEISQRPNCCTNTHKQGGAPLTGHWEHYCQLSHDTQYVTGSLKSLNIKRHQQEKRQSWCDNSNMLTMSWRMTVPDLLFLLVSSLCAKVR